MTPVGSQIEEFFKDQTVFITGGSGFLGKVLIEKLLRECEDLKKIYVLMRPKKNKSSTQRFQELFDYACFDRIRSKGVKEKVFLVEGDCQKPVLGLSQHDVHLLKEEVTCVIHAAANVKFEQTLKEAANNVKLTKDVVLLAKEMTKLKAFVHVSTAYSNCIHTVVKEEFYEPPMTAEALFTITEGLEDDVLQAITPKLLGRWPNTYVYTKCISEDVVKTLGKDLPVATVRPAVVINTIEEPMPGWIDNFYGLIGIVAAAALGLIRSLHVKLDGNAYVVPVDYVSNLVLAAAWNAHRQKEVAIYNFVGHRKNMLQWKEVQKHLEVHCWSAATEKAVWYYCFKMRENKLCHDICIFFLHTVVAYVVDFVLFCLGKPTLAVKNYRRLNKMLNLISYFSTGTWYFDDDNVMKLWERMGDEDRKRFKFNMEKVDFNKFARDAVFGARLYLLKETKDTIPKGEKKLKMLFVAHYTLLAFFWFLVLKMAMFFFNLLIRNA